MIVKSKILIGILSTTLLTSVGAAKADDSLYRSFGEKDGITRLVDEFIGQVAADGRINQFFAHANIPRLKLLLVDQLCQATGGPCAYNGRDMVSSHQGMGVSDTAFNALAEDLEKAMDKSDISYHAQNRLLAILAPLERQIVTK